VGAAWRGARALLQDNLLTRGLPRAALRGAARRPWTLLGAGLVAAALFVCSVLYLLYIRGKPIPPLALLTLALAFCAMVPWCLPSMHDRYFYMADVFAVCYAVAHPRRFYVAPMMVFASYAGYHCFLFGEYLPLGGLSGLWLPALMVAGVGGIALWDLRKQLAEDSGQ